MRMCSLHPAHLDRAGLVACWRESLLAQAVLAGRTRGYRHHPQIQRFRATADPAAAVGAYLWGLHDEASERGYRFDAGRIDVPRQRCTDVDLPVTTGQMAAERTHLEVKLARRAPELLPLPERLDPHPVFHVVPGPVEDWERAAP